MEINGRNYHNPEIQLREIKLALSRMPVESPLRPHFDFLTGLIDVQTDELQAHQQTVEAALKEFGCEEGDSRAADLEALIDFAREMQSGLAAKVSTELIAATP